MNKMRFYSLLLTTTCFSLVQAAEKQPDMAFLEYLAELVEVNGELVGPLDFKTVVAQTQHNDIDSGQNKDEQVETNKAKPASPDKNKMAVKVETKPPSNTDKVHSKKGNHEEDKIND